jgi:uncharacterized protein DUF6930
MKITKQNRELWLALYAAAEKFKELAPWQWMYDSDIFGIEDPESGETGYCIVMGNLGEVFALGVYWGKEGFQTYLNLLDAHDGEASEVDREIAGLEQKMLKVEFVNRQYMSKKDLAQVKALGLQFRGANQWVQFREMKPGYHPWYIDGKQAAFLTLALEQALDVTSRFKNNKALLQPRNEKMLVRVPVESKNGLEWKDDYRYEPDWEEEEETAPVNPFLVERAKKELKRKAGAVCFSLSYMPGGVRGEKGEAPSFAMIGIWILYDSGFIAGFDLYQPGQLKPSFEQNFFNELFSLGYLPEQLVVNSIKSLEMVKPYTAALGIKLIYAPEYPVFREVIESMSGFMR